MRAQVSIEYLLITGFSLALIAPLLILFASQSIEVQDQFRQSQAQQAADAITQSAQRVYYAGPPSKETFNIRLPDAVDEFIISSSAVTLRLSQPTTDVVSSTDTPLLPATLNPAKGYATITVTATASGVQISDS